MKPIDFERIFVYVKELADQSSLAPVLKEEYKEEIEELIVPLVVSTFDEIWAQAKRNLQEKPSKEYLTKAMTAMCALSFEAMAVTGVYSEKIQKAFYPADFDKEKENETEELSSKETT